MIPPVSPIMLPSAVSHAGSVDCSHGICASVSGVANLPRFLSLVVGCWFAVCLNAGERVDYLADIKPLLAEKCYSCHGALKQEAGLRLETLALMLEADVLQPGVSLDSELVSRVVANDDSRMPPAEAGAPLQPDQIQLLRDWIEQGAHAPDEDVPLAPKDHWAFQAISRPELSADEGEELQHPIDVLLRRQRSKEQVVALDLAPKPLRIRRLYLGLTGQPPTRDQLRDTRDWQVIVDELLSSPAYGERWARHWMDIWRYSDWYGLGKQVRYSQKHLWHWRDWIIQSLNHDKGYDRMILEMLAGDELAPEDPQVLAGTGFLARNYYLFNRTTWLDSTIEHTGKAFLGLTFNCAKCHDHKYDPISQLDYYRLRAIFEPHQIRLDPVPGQTDLETDGLPRAFDDDTSRATYVHLRGDPKQPDKTQPVQPGVPEILAGFAEPIESVELPAYAFAPGTRQQVFADRLKAVEGIIRAAEKQVEQAKHALEQQRSQENDKSQPVEPSFRLNETFDQLDERRWQLEGEHWELRDGQLCFIQPTRDQASATLLAELPADFELDCQFVTTGGSEYKSVTFRFDESVDGKFSNTVYSSAHAPGPKVQVSYSRNGKTSYPAAGRVALPIQVGEPQRLRFAVQGTLVNVWHNGSFVLAYRLPSRLAVTAAGSFSLNAFDATVAFDSLEIRALSPDTTLQPAGTKEPPASPESALDRAEAKRHWAETQRAALIAVYQADCAKVGVRDTSEEAQVRFRQLALNAHRAQLDERLAAAEHRILESKSDPKTLKTTQKERDALRTALKDLPDSNELLASNSVPAYRPLRASKKALESPADKEEDYPAMYPEVSSGRRLALAKWIVDKQNPLTARVAVNHVWLRHFGRPIVESVFDFGLRAKKPDQALLLDLLASELVQSGWSLKHLHRLIVTSQTYQLSSAAADADPQMVSRDPDNRSYWRGNAWRMESQLVRDVLLSLAGQLDHRMGGPSDDTNQGSRRKSVYLKHSRDQQEKFLTLFDDADILQCYRRSASIVPQQALALSNSELAIKMSGHIAQRIKAESLDEFIEEAFVTLLARRPSTKEHLACSEFCEQLLQLDAFQELSVEEQRRRQRVRMIHVLINHNDFITIR